MKTIYQFFLLALAALIPFYLNAQQTEAGIVEKPHDPSEKLTLFSETPFALDQVSRDADPAIAAMVGAVSIDSMKVTLQEMQNWGSRFLMNDNNREIATSLMNKFLSIGYTDVKLDSFYLRIFFGPLADSGWQYNVICTLRGKSAPDEVYVVGGHYDSYSNADPVNNAPGVDDNGTAVAATFEIARLFKQFNYQPEATIRFTLFAAEELGLFGGRAAAAKARAAGTDIRYMLNMDMIANDPDSMNEVRIYQYYGMEWAGLLAADVTERYTDLVVVVPANLASAGSDSFPYWVEGFPCAYFEENDFSPNWHQLSDTLGNCNLSFLKKVTGAALATLAEQQLTPYPQNLRSHSAKERITLQWKPTKNANVKGCNIYRSENSGGTYQKLSSVPVANSVYDDVPAALNKQYYYVITTVNDSLQESAYSNEVIGARFNFSDSLLVLANVKGDKSTPDSILEFYRVVLDTIPYKWMDVNAAQKPDLGHLSRYRTILWLTNSLEYEPVTAEMIQGVSAYLENGGNFMYAGFYPGKCWIGNFTYPLYIPEGIYFREWFKVDSLDRKIQSMLFRANPAGDGYPTLNIDSLKMMDPNFPGQVFNIEVFHPTEDGRVIYRFDSKFDSATSYGKMKNRPVGIEYMGPGHKSILLSFPLCYLDTADARDLMHFVVTKKFGYPVGINQPAPADPFALHVFPNPVHDACNVTFNLEQPGHIRVWLVSPMGKNVGEWIDGKLEKGTYWYRFDTSSLARGMYQLVLQQGSAAVLRKVIVFR